jgi:MFS family permease
MRVRGSTAVQNAGLSDAAARSAARPRPLCCAGYPYPIARESPVRDVREQLYARLTWRLVPFLFACYVCAYLDRVNVGFAKLHMQHALAFSDTIYGFGAGIFFIGYFLFEVPSNLVLHRYGARRTIARIMIAWGLISAAMAFVTTPLEFYILRFLLGVAEAGFFPGIILYLTYWFPRERRGRVTALFVTAVPIASVLGGPLSGYIMQNLDTWHALAGWQWLFILEGLPSVAFGIAAWYCLADRLSEADWLRDDERRLIEADLAREAASVPHRQIKDGLLRGRVWHLAAIYFCLVMGLYGLSFWLPTLVAELGYRTPLTIGLVSAIPFGAAAVVMVAIGRHADRSNERRWHMVVPAGVGALALLASLALRDQPVLAIAALTASACGILSAIPQTWNLATAFLGGGAAASGIALVNSFGNLSGFVGPYAIGFLRGTTGSTTGGIGFLAVALLVGGVLVLAVPAHLVRGP